jgi:hypothetical protein
MEAAVVDLRSTARVLDADRVPAGASLLDVVRIAESMLRSPSTTVEPESPVRVVMFPRGESLHRLLGSTGSSTYCGRSPSATAIHGMLTDWVESTPRCAVCFRLTVAEFEKIASEVFS